MSACCSYRWWGAATGVSLPVLWAAAMCGVSFIPRHRRDGSLFLFNHFIFDRVLHVQLTCRLLTGCADRADYSKPRGDRPAARRGGGTAGSRGAREALWRVTGIRRRNESPTGTACAATDQKQQVRPCHPHHRQQGPEPRCPSGVSSAGAPAAPAAPQRRPRRRKRSHTSRTRRCGAAAGRLHGGWAAAGEALGGCSEVAHGLPDGGVALEARSEGELPDAVTLAQPPLLGK